MRNRIIVGCNDSALRVVAWDDVSMSDERKALLSPLPLGYKGSRRGNESCDPVCLVLRCPKDGGVVKK